MTDSPATPSRHPLITEAPALSPDAPWPGLIPYSEATRRFFFGRDRDLDEIQRRLTNSPLTILHGPSGLGKTSLLGAGLIPRLRDQRCRPLLCRLSFEPGDSPILEQFTAAVHGVLGISQNTPPPPSRSLWELFHHRRYFPPASLAEPPIVILDQFEEIFTRGVASRPSSEIDAFFLEVADLIENRPSAFLKEAWAEGTEGASEFDFEVSPFRLVITLREDFLSRLEKWRVPFPSLMRNRMALLPLSGYNALDAVVRPARLDGRNLVSEHTARKIVSFAAGVGPEIPLEEVEVNPPLLNLLCLGLNERRLRSSNPPSGAIQADAIESEGADVLTRFYESCFADFPPVTAEPVREFVEERCITVEGNRNSVAIEDARADLAARGVDNPGHAIELLIAKRLLTSEHRGRTQRIEVAHDVLAGLVAGSRLHRRKLKEAQLRELRLMQELQERERLEKERKIREEELHRQVARLTTSHAPHKSSRWAAIVFSLTVTLAGIVFHFLRPGGESLAHVSFDFASLFATRRLAHDFVIVGVDESSHSEFGSPSALIPRRVWARLLDRLTAEGARLVVFDLLFLEPTTEDDDRAFASAIARNGNVVLAALESTSTESTAGVSQTIMPPRMFATNAVAIGSSELAADADSVIRHLPLGFGSIPSLPLAAAVASDRTVFQEHARSSLLLNYRNPIGPLEVLPLSSVLRGDSPGAFRGKYVFVGSVSKTTSVGALKDYFATPFSRIGAAPLPGVAVQAIAFTNLLSRDWIRKPALIPLVLTAAALGVLISVSLFWLRPRWAVVVAISWAVIIASIGIFIHQAFRVHIPWMIPLIVQLPLALVWVSWRNWLMLPPPIAFFSYRGSDVEASNYALAFWSALRNQGINTFLDRQDLGVGDFARMLTDQISRCDNFILILSPAAFERPGAGHDFCARELQFALELNKNIIVISSLSKPATVPEPFNRLVHAHWLVHNDGNPQRTIAELSQLLRPKRFSRLWFTQKARAFRRSNAQVAINTH